MKSAAWVVLGLLGCQAGEPAQTGPLIQTSTVPGEELGASLLPYAVSISRSEDCPLDAAVYLPPAWSRDDRRPALVVVGSGVKHGGHLQLEKYSRYFAARGWMAISPDLASADRCASERPMLPSIVAAIFPWVQAHADQLGIDRDRIMALGAGTGARVLLSWSLAGSRPEAQLAPRALLLLHPAFTAGSAWFDGDQLPSWEVAAFVAHRPLPLTLLMYHRADTQLDAAQTFSARFALAGGTVALQLAGGEQAGFYSSPIWFQRTALWIERFLGSFSSTAGRSPSVPPSADSH